MIYGPNGEHRVGLVCLQPLRPNRTSFGSQRSEFGLGLIRHANKVAVRFDHCELHEFGTRLAPLYDGMQAHARRARTRET